METEKLKKAFQLFVSNDDMRPEMMQPFRQVDTYCATDAHTLIYMPTEGIELGYPEQAKPNFKPVIPQGGDKYDIIQIAKLRQQLEAMAQMTEEVIDCDECHGEGTVSVSYYARSRHYHLKAECPICKGECYTLTGNKVPDGDQYFNLLGVIFAQRILIRLVEACEILDLTNITRVSGGPIGANLFIHGKIGIILMPINFSHDQSIFDDAAKIQLD